MTRVTDKFEVDAFTQEIPSGTVDASNVTFTLAHTPHSTASVLLLLNSVPQVQGTDYTISGVTITMAVAPAHGQQLFVQYEKA